MSARALQYQWGVVALLRASTDPGGLDLPENLDLSGPQATLQGTAWLAQLWRRDDVRSAFAEASPALCEQIGTLIGQPAHDPRRVRRTVIATASYLLRWQRRAIPFGLFAGVGAVRIGDDAKVRWGEGHRAWLRADAGWLAGVISRLHRCPELMRRLGVVASNAAVVRGDRIVAPGAASDLDVQALAPLEASVRGTRPVREALEAASEPVKLADLSEHLHKQFPAASPDQIHAMLSGLIDQQMLISSLRAPMADPDALAHLCTELDAAGAAGIPEVGDLVRELAAIRDLLGSGAAPGQVTARMRGMCRSTEVPLLTDTALDCDVHIPEQVAREAADAAGVLLRLSSYPFGFPTWRDYHARFRARYGTGALVPVLDLVADSGLGWPAEYLGSANGRAARQVTPRDEKLMALIQQATVDGTGEIVLTDPVIEHLASVPAADLVPPPSLEIAFEVHAASIEALASGRFRLSVTGTPRPGSSMAGRHASPLPPEDVQAIAGCLAAAEPDAIAAQLSFPPRKRRNENLVRTGRLLAHVIPIGEDHTRYDRTIALSDLAVTADDRHFHLVQVSTGRRVAPRAVHALEASIQTPPLARFLSDIVTARCAAYQAFGFGAAARLPYLPRVRYRRTILSVARWLLNAGDLPGRSASEKEWDSALSLWRQRWRVPDHVAIVEHDRRQPIDLGHRLHRLLLRTRLDRSGAAELREAPTPHDLGWMGRAHEVLLPLVLKTPAPASPLPISAPVRTVAVDEAGLPGTCDVVYAQLHTHPARINEVLTDRLPQLLADLHGVSHWWFRRHRSLRHPQTEPYLALYFQLPDPAGYGPAAAHLAAWADRLRRDRLMAHLSLASYQPQHGRYGTGEAQQAAYRVFAADSAAAMAQVTTAIRTGIHTQALAAASLVDLAVAFAGSAPDGLHWLVHGLEHDRGPLDPALRRQSLELADPDPQRMARHPLPAGSEITGAWQARAEALSDYVEHLCAQRDPFTVLRLLLRLHHNRAVGPDPDAERVTLRLARACALHRLATTDKEA